MNELLIGQAASNITKQSTITQLSNNQEHSRWCHLWLSSLNFMAFALQFSAVVGSFCSHSTRDTYDLLKTTLRNLRKAFQQASSTTAHVLKPKRNSLQEKVHKCICVCNLLILHIIYIVKHILYVSHIFQFHIIITYS